MTARDEGDAGRPAPSAGRAGARVLALLVPLALVAACSAESQPAAVVGSGSPAPTTASPSPTPATAPSPEPSPEPTTSPLSGRKGGVGTPVVVVKLDNTPSAQPHVGLTKADIVYVEPVEWGLNRLAAVYSTSIPETVGPVRSARISDIEVFAPFGDVAFVYSGAQMRLQPKIAAASWTAVSEDFESPGLVRDGSRSIPYNMMAKPREILATSGASATSRDMGWVFGKKRVRGGTKARTVTARWPDASMQFRWNAKAGSYDVWMNGRQARDTQPPGVQRASTVIVQYVKETDSGYGDMFGGRTPKSRTVGSGTGVLLRDGRSHRITWERSRAQDPTTYLDADGDPVVMDPGQVWIVLKDRTRKVVIG